ncbi:hypothetical protein K7X08_020996 [Anisodus acutangulus]|uniref:Uncharacterized protein n=1 Tax=Anisodus acutangulus TaxID=402998 RepID=A0A9Q1RR11_9SOLA|nr:hypothetical protein K7X08_020996 [Anisodus acutangulus]
MKKYLHYEKEFWRQKAGRNLHRRPTHPIIPPPFPITRPQEAPLHSQMACDKRKEPPRQGGPPQLETYDEYGRLIIEPVEFTQNN